MRKVSLKIGAAFHTGRKRAMGNTMTDGNAVYLYGNKIIERCADGIYFTLAGCPTATTRERINSMTNAVISQKTIDKVPYQFRGGVTISENEWYKV